MKLILDNGEVFEFRDWDAMVLDNALVAFNAAKENVSYFDEETRRGIYASYERLRAIVPFLGNEQQENRMNKAIEELLQMPHNQLRKATCLKQCILNLEELQRKYKPIFDEDAFIKNLLVQLLFEYDRVMELLHREKDIDALFQAADQED